MVAMAVAAVTAAAVTSTTLTPTTVTAAALKAAGMAVGTIESGHLAVLGRLGSGLVKPHQVIIEIAAVRGLGRCGGRTCRADGDDQGSGEEGCKSAHDSLRVGADLSRRKRNASDAYSGFVKISAQTSPGRRRRPDAE